MGRHLQRWRWCNIRFWFLDQTTPSNEQLQSCGQCWTSCSRFRPLWCGTLPWVHTTFTITSTLWHKLKFSVLRNITLRCGTTCQTDHNRQPGLPGLRPQVRNALHDTRRHCLCTITRGFPASSKGLSVQEVLSWHCHLTISLTLPLVLVLVLITLRPLYKCDYGDWLHIQNVEI